MVKIFLIVFFLFNLSVFSQVNQIKKVEVIQSNDGFRLVKDNKPYYIKGAGGYEHLDLLSNIGGNSIRTWGTENAIEILDQAYQKGISVCMGLWVGHERHGFDYNDEYAITSQLEAFKKQVLKLKDHPALLMWSVGNEVDLFYKNFKVWNAVEDIAKMIKELDPNHPVMTVTAGIEPCEVYMIKNYCPSIDILGVNTYGGIDNLGKMIRMYGWEKPYIVTEWGPHGHWESPNTDWDVAIEKTSKEKAKAREIAYKHIIDDKDLCLGSYAFLWGSKQEYTSTWYGIFTEDDKTTQSIDVLNSYWNNIKRNKAPIINTLFLNNKSMSESVKVRKRSECIFEFNVKDPEEKKLFYNFEIMPESTDKRSGGEAEKAPESLPIKILEQSKERLVVKAPNRSGPYRFFIFVSDEYNNVATANFPFYVK